MISALNTYLVVRPQELKKLKKQRCQPCKTLIYCRGKKKTETFSPIILYSRWAQSEKFPT